MAECKICGAVKKSHPSTWTNWECNKCTLDLIRGVVGVHSKAERQAAEDARKSSETPFEAANVSQKITWGEPAKICEASFDKHCPHCGHGRQDGFDLGINNGVVFGGWCDCGFSF